MLLAGLLRLFYTNLQNSQKSVFDQSEYLKLSVKTRETQTKKLKTQNVVSDFIFSHKQFN